MADPAPYYANYPVSATMTVTLDPPVPATTVPEVMGSCHDIVAANPFYAQGLDKAIAQPVHVAVTMLKPPAGNVPSDQPTPWVEVGIADPWYLQPDHQAVELFGVVLWAQNDGAGVACGESGRVTPGNSEGSFGSVLLDPVTPGTPSTWTGWMVMWPGPMNINNVDRTLVPANAVFRPRATLNGQPATSRYRPSPAVLTCGVATTDAPAVTSIAVNPGAATALGCTRPG